MRIFNWIRNILFVLAIVVILFAASCFIFGLKPSVVMSDSMNPSYSNVAPYAKGSLAIIKKGGPYEVGKPIAFYNGNMFVMHRLVDIQEENGVRYYITKGDANQTEDPARTLEESLVGHVLFSIPLIGYLIHFVSTKSGMIIAGSIILCLILSMFIVPAALDKKEDKDSESEKKKEEGEKRGMFKRKAKEETIAIPKEVSAAAPTEISSADENPFIIKDAGPAAPKKPDLDEDEFLNALNMEVIHNVAGEDYKAKYEEAEKKLSNSLVRYDLLKDRYLKLMRFMLSKNLISENFYKQEEQNLH